MDSFFEFVFSKGEQLLTSDSTVALVVIVLVIVLLSFIALKGLAGLGFWGRKRNKIAEFEFQYGDWRHRMFIYQLSAKSGYQGYGVELTETRFKQFSGNMGMKTHASAIEFSRDEASQLVQLIRPYL